MTTATIDRTLVTGGNPDEPYHVPPEDAFISDAGDMLDFLDADDVRRIATALIDRHAGFEHLRPMRIAYLWKRAGGKAGGKATLGKCVKVSGLTRHFGDYHFAIWIAADHAEEHGLSAWQVEALVYHELGHAGINEKFQPVLVPHDVEMFAGEVKVYGTWKLDLEIAADAFQQAPLFDL